MSSCNTRPCWPQIAVKRSSHFSAAWFSTAGFSFSIGETWTLLIALGATTPCAWAMGSISGFLDRNRNNSGRDMLARSRGGSTVWSSNQSWNHFVRSLLPAGNSIGGPLPNFASSSRSSLSIASLSTDSPFSSCVMLSVLVRAWTRSLRKSSYRFSTACTNEKPARSAMCSYALRNALCSGAENGPGINSCLAPATSPPLRSTIMQERLSMEPRSMARLQTAAATCPRSGAFSSAISLRSPSAINSITSLFGKLPSEMPSQTRTTKSVGPAVVVVNSGSAETGWSSCAGPPVSLCGASPKARLTAKSPLTRATPWTICTVPPHRSILSLSEA
mmetsp:Transcript_68446/g.173792  ORF Transcript_68446/g.173792 Transcript_68446/m.173792 type:complete len:332 (+) Transcript_68446:785-1780(+)